MLSRKKTKDDSYTLFSQIYDQTFHSMHGAKTESVHVFLKGSGIEHRLQGKMSTRLLEVGFGTGLNFFLTAQVALTHRCTLDYWALEKQLLPTNTIKSLNFSSYLPSHPILDQFLDWRAMLPADPNEGLLACPLGNNLSLNIIVGDATTAPLPDRPFDAVYLDAFSPDHNPELWTVPFLSKLHEALHVGGKLATYSAKSLVRKNLMTAGFKTTKQPGPPGKREMLVGERVQ